MKFEKCDICGEKIAYESSKSYQDDCYEIDGDIICEDCIEKYVRKNFYKKLEE